MKKAPELQEPLNSLERFMAHISYRLDIIIEQNNSIVEFLASQNHVAVTESKLEVQEEHPVEKPKKTRTKKVK